MTMLTKDQVEDFWAEIQARGLGRDDFEFQEYVSPLPAGGVAIELGTVFVRRKSNGRNKTYRVTGYECSWPRDFCNDLAAGYFDE